MKASQSIYQFPAKVMPLQKSSGGAKLVSVHPPSIHPSITEKISISLRPGLGLRSPIVERNKRTIGHKHSVYKYTSHVNNREIDQNW